MLAQLFHFRAVVVSAALLLMLAIPSSAANITGTVMNGTTGAPAPGDDVVLIRLSESGMNEIAHAKSDETGAFRIPLANFSGSYLVRVFHSGVTYHQAAASPEKPLTIQVYDVAQRVDGIAAVADVQRFETEGDMLEVRQVITMHNASSPPRTLMNAQPFELQLPSEAQIESGLVQVEDAQALKYKPVPGAQGGQYYFVFPLRPGETRFAVVYRLPYHGDFVVEPHIRNAREQFVVMLPKSMGFEPKVSGIFRPMKNVTADNVQGSVPVSPGDTVAFRISGTGSLAEFEDRREQARASEKARPGGGLGPPTELPDPLHNYRWGILVGFGSLLFAGAAYIIKKPSLHKLVQDRPLDRIASRKTPKQRMGLTNARRKPTVRV